MLFWPTLVERLRSRSPLVVRLLVGVLTLFAVTPFLATLRPPLQDFPQHLAAGHVLLAPNDPELRFSDYFHSEWLRSQYLGIYVLLGLFYYPLSWFTEQPLLLASRFSLVVLLVSWATAGEWLGFRLLRRSGFGAFFLVLFFNAHLILGFLNFLLGVACCFLTLGVFAEARARRALSLRGRSWVLSAGFGVLSLATFYFHVVPFAVLLTTVLGTLVLDRLLARLGPGRKLFTYTLPLADYAALVPSLFALGAWLFSPAGQSTQKAAQGGDAKLRAVFTSAQANTEMLDAWLMDVFRSPLDTKLMYLAVGALGVFIMLEGIAVFFARVPDTAAHDERSSDMVLVWLLRLGAPACAAAYYVAPASYDWIWPINARFPLLAMLLLPFWLPVSKRRAWRWGWIPLARRVSFLAYMLVVSFASAGETTLARDAFRGFANETDGLDDVLLAIPKGKKVATLVFDRGSRFVAFSPFLHVGAYYQAERGGVSYFSFNDFPQSPVRFLTEDRPPKAKPRWEWKPEAVRPDEELGWFDYMIVRGGPPTLKGNRSFTQQLQAGRFRLFKNNHTGADDDVSP